MADLIDGQTPLAPCAFQCAMGNAVGFRRLCRGEAQPPGREFRGLVVIVFLHRILSAAFAAFDYDARLGQANCTFTHGCAWTRKRGRIHAGNGPSLFHNAHPLRGEYVAPTLRALSIFSDALPYLSPNLFATPRPLFAIRIPLAVSNARILPVLCRRASSPTQ